MLDIWRFMGIRSVAVYTIRALCYYLVTCWGRRTGGNPHVTWYGGEGGGGGIDEQVPLVPSGPFGVAWWPAWGVGLEATHMWTCYGGGGGLLAQAMSHARVGCRSCALIRRRRA